MPRRRECMPARLLSLVSVSDTATMAMVIEAMDMAIIVNLKMSGEFAT